MRSINYLRHVVMALSIGIVTQSLFAEPENLKAGPSRDIAEWSFLTYIAADNNLADFASYNINDMIAGLATAAGTNILVQWDQPSNQKTWRYKITPSGKIDVGSLSAEMGYNPEKELVASAQWMVTNYPAKRYGITLWNHGSGVEDLEPAIAKSPRMPYSPFSSWMQIPGSNVAGLQKNRGILYDDSQGTCLTNQGLTSALTQIKKMIGKNIDLVATDACLMAMIEVAYQIKGLVDIFIGSQETIPGTGFPYSKFMNPLSKNPSGTTPLMLSQYMVSSYQNYYTNQDPTSDFTLSSIDINSIGKLKENINQFIAAVAACSKANAQSTKTMIVNARKAATSFNSPEYIDLYSLYSGILNRMKKSRPKSLAILGNLLNPNNQSGEEESKGYKDALATLRAVILDGMNVIGTVVIQSVSGPSYPGVKGISIYYPKTGAIHSSYPATMFAKETGWIKFIQQYR